MLHRIIAEFSPDQLGTFGEWLPHLQGRYGLIDLTQAQTLPEKFIGVDREGYDVNLMLEYEAKTGSYYCISPR